MEDKTIYIHRKIIHNGLEISLKRKKYQINYPSQIWKELPIAFHQNFSDAVAYALTMHLCLNGHQKLIYDFPHPQFEPFFFEGMIYSLGETALTNENGERTSDFLKLFYNRYLNIEFASRPRHIRFKNFNRNTKNRAVIPFTFGKDSLLTFALAREMGIETCPIFFREPKSPFENRHKKKLADRFYDEFDMDINFFPVSAGRLRQTFGNWWGWDLLLTQYTLLLLPFVFGLRARFLFWGHEQSCNDFLTDAEGFRINPVFEQSRRWLLTSNNLARALGGNAIFSSLVEPIHEIAIMKILHYRYPQIAKYQMSCFADEEPARTKRWCGVCSKCARMYIFMLALGITPRKVSFFENMLIEKKRNLYTLFKKKMITTSSYDQSGLGRDEQLLAFYLAYKKGAKGSLMKEFKEKYLLEARSRERELRETFFGTHSSDTLIYELKNPLLKIFQEELSDFI